MSLAAHLELSLAFYQFAVFLVQLDNISVPWSLVDGREKLFDRLGTTLGLALDL